MTTNEWKRRTHTVPMKGDGQPIEDVIGELHAQLDAIDIRLSKMEKGPAAPKTRRVFDADTPAPEYLVPVDRHAGIIGGDYEPGMAGEGLPRALSSRRTPGDSLDDTPAPEYYVEVNRRDGTVG